MTLGLTVLWCINKKQGLVFMYTLLFVEDEYNVRKAIINTIDWDSLGFRIIGEAENGLEAIDIVEKYKPDVIITDIKMPFMDGIEFAKLVREINPVTKIVFLTGFNDFDYAISAIKLNVIEYLSKPVSAEKMRDTLISIKRKLDEENNYLRNVEILRQNYIESLPIIRTGFLLSLITSYTSSAQINNNIQRLSLNLNGPWYLIFTVRIDRGSTMDIESTEGIEDIDVIFPSLVNIAKRVSDKYLLNETFEYGENIVTILSDTKENIDNYAEILMHEIQQSIYKNYGLQVIIGVSNMFKNLEEAKKEFDNSVTALSYCSIMGTNKAIYLRDIEPARGINFVFDEKKEREFSSILKTGTKDILFKFISGIFNELAAKEASLSDFQICIIEMITTLIKTAQSSISDFTEKMDVNMGLLLDVYKSQTIDEAKYNFKKLCSKVMEYIDLERQDMTAVLVNKGYEYMKSNYSDPELSLRTVSKYLHISSNYFSIIFKRVIGEPFKNVLIRIRMEKAYELLATTNMRILEVAKEVGYNDQHYFSYSFKKYFNISPSEMRSRQNNGVMLGKL